MKKKILPFLLYAFAIVLVLVLFLVLSKVIENANKNNINGREPSTTQPTADNKGSNTGNQPSHTEQDVTFSLLSENTIYMHIDSSVEFTNDFFIVNNADVSNITGQVLSHYNSDVSKLIYNNRTLKATVLDSYKLAFTLATDKTTITKNLTIYVVDEPKITQNKESFKVGDEINIEEMLTFESSITTYEIETSENLTYIDNKIKVNSAGEGNVSVSYVVSGVKYTYSFKTYSTEIPRYSILINSENISLLETELSREYFSFSYELFDLDGQPSVDQTINIAVADESIVSVDTIAHPIISLKLNKVGTTTLTITVDDDLNFSKTIQIIIK